MAAGEGAEELIVEVVAVGDHDDGRVLHRRVQDHASRVEGHREALARALRVPDDAHASIARFTARLAPSPVPSRCVRDVPLGESRCAQRFFHRSIDGVELVIAGHLLDELAAALVLEDNEITQKVEKTAPLKNAIEQHLELRNRRRRIDFAGECARA